MAQSIFGNGGLYIELATDTSTNVSFNFAFSNIRFEKVNVRQTAITGRIHQTTLYFRPVIEAQIVMCNQDDVQSFITLNNLLQLSVSDGINVYPNYNALTNNINTPYLCYLDSDIEYLQIDSRVQVGQTITLKFIAKELITQLPQQFTIAATYYYVAANGDSYLDGSGNKYIQ